MINPSFLFSFILSLVFLVGSPDSSQAQVYLQIEIFNSAKTIKFVSGDVIRFKTKEFPKNWQIGRLEKILLEENVVILDGVIYQLDDFKELKTFRSWAHSASWILNRFGIAWFAFAGIADLANLQAGPETFKIGGDTVAVGGAAFGLAAIIKYGFGKKRYKLGKNSRLRLIDLRFSIKE